MLSRGYNFFITDIVKIPMPIAIILGYI